MVQLGKTSHGVFLSAEGLEMTEALPGLSYRAAAGRNLAGYPLKLNH